MSGFPCIVVHCGIELDNNDLLTMERTASCRKSACIGHEKLRSGGSAVEAVEAALRWLEDDELFNCGYGSAVQLVGSEAQVGQVSMDATIVEGAKGRTGSVLGVSRFDHPISLARRALASAPNAVLGPAMEPEVGRPTAGAAEQTRRWAAESALSQRVAQPMGALGCVAWDGASLAAGSTSGGPQAGASLLGSGLYADSLFGCSLTSHGDAALPLGLARRAADFPGLARTLDSLLLPAGAVCLLTDGSLLLHHTGKRMPFAYVAKDGTVTVQATSLSLDRLYS